MKQYINPSDIDNILAYIKIKDNKKSILSANSHVSKESTDLLTRNYIVFDTETTGFARDYDDIVQFSIIDNKNNKLFDEKYRNERPYKARYKENKYGEIERGIIPWEIHRVLPEQQVNRPVFKTSLDDALPYFENADFIVGHNVKYDLEMIAGTIDRAKKETVESIETLRSKKDDFVFLKKYNEDMGYFINYLHLIEKFDKLLQTKPVYDTLPECKEYFSTNPEVENNKLGTVAEYYRKKYFPDFNFRAHDSLEDVKATNLVFTGLIMDGWKPIPRNFTFKGFVTKTIKYIDKETGEQKEFDKQLRKFDYTEYEDLSENERQKFIKMMGPDTLSLRGEWWDD